MSQSTRTLLAACLAIWFAPGLCAQSQSGTTAKLSKTAAGEQIRVEFAEHFLYDQAANTATVSEGSIAYDLNNVSVLGLGGSSAQIFKANAAPLKTSIQDFYTTVTLSNFLDANHAIVSLADVAKQGLQLFVVLNTTKKDKLSTIPVDVVTEPQKFRLAAETHADGTISRDLITLVVQNGDAGAIYTKLTQHPGSVGILYDFGPTSTESNIKTHAKKLTLNSDSQTIEILPAVPPPYHSPAYKATVEIPPADLPAGQESSNKVTTTANFPAQASTTSKPIYDFEPTLTSAVNKTKEQRTTAGLFALTVNPVVFIKQWNIKNDPGSNKPPSRFSYWWDFRPNISANVDTQPEKSSTTPNRITMALDSEFGVNRLRSASGYDYLIWTNGARSDADRDFKLFDTYWHTDVALGIWKASESQQYRINSPPELGKPVPAPKHLVVTAYQFIPSFGFDEGSVTIRQGSIDPTLGGSVSRFVLKLDTMLELWRNLTFTAVDTSYYLFDASRRNARGFFDGEIAINTGLLTHLDMQKIQSSILFKYQRGEQPPKFTPTDTLSLGFKISK